MSESSIKVFLVLYFLLYYGILFVWNSLIVFKKTGKNPYVLGRSKGAMGYVERSIQLVGIAIIVILSMYVLSQGVYLWLVPIQYLEGLPYDCAGIAMMSLGFVVCVMAQHYMRTSWRIGIDANSDVHLVEDGIFRYSRNPFFLGTILSYAGFFLILPNILSFTVGVVYYVLIQIQVRFEEESLVRCPGSPYDNYCAKVRRWV